MAAFLHKFKLEELYYGNLFKRIWQEIRSQTI